MIDSDYVEGIHILACIFTEDISAVNCVMVCTLQRNNKYWDIDLEIKQEREKMLRDGVAFIAQSDKVSRFLAKGLRKTVWHAIMAINLDGQGVIANGRYS